MFATPATLRQFQSCYGSAPTLALRAPARINIIGEHVDYVRYLPTASLAFGSREHAMTMLVRATDDESVGGASTNAEFAPFNFRLDECAPPATAGWEAWVFGRPAPAPDWSNYARGAVSLAQWKHGAQIKRGVEFLIDSTVPARAGASSSSALVVLAGAAIRLVNEIAFTRAELAQDSARAEWFLGTRGGALDHTTICLAELERAVHIAHDDASARLLPLASSAHRWITFFSHPADKGRAVMLEYNERAAIARIVLPALLDQARARDAAFAGAWAEAEASLRQDAAAAETLFAPLLDQLPATVTLAQLVTDVREDCRRAFPALLAARAEQPLKLRDRARHHVGEIARTARAAQLLKETGAPTPQLGALLDQSHGSLRDLYDVSTPEVEALREVVRNQVGVLGARLMGGGFGGNVLALVAANGVQSLIDHVQHEFYEPRGRNVFNEGAVMVSTPGDGLTW